MRTFAQKPKAGLQTSSTKPTIPGRVHFGHSHDLKSILHLQRTIGNQAVQRLLGATATNVNGDSVAEIARFGHDFSRIPVYATTPIRIQPKLTVNALGDIYEHEADRVAEQVMRMPEPQRQHACPCGGGCPKCQTERLYQGNQRLQTKHVESGALGLTAAPPIVLNLLRSRGQPLDPTIRAFMEPRFGHDFSQVRVHFGEASEQSARHMNASAYTVGHNIVFGAGQFVPGTTEGKRLLAHELTHVVQQRGDMGERMQRAPFGGPTAPVKALESLEAVAQRIARLAVGPSSASVNLKGGPDKVVSVVRNSRTGKICVGLNTGTPAEPTRVIDEAINAQKARIRAGKVNVVHTAEDAMGGGHAEVNALDKAIAEEEVALGHAMTEEEITATFEMHNVWLSGKHKLTAAGRCEHCRRITRGVSVTESLFKAEGGVSGEINVPQRGMVVKTGGKVVELETIHGEIPSPKPAVKPTITVPEQVPETVPEVKIPGGLSVGESAVKLVVTEIALNVLLFAVTYYLNKWHAEKQVRKFNGDLKGLLPEVNTRLQNKEAKIVEKRRAFPLVYGNITIVYTHDKYEPEDYNEGSMSIQDVAISHQNYQTPERLIKDYSPLSGNDPSYSLTFSVPLFEERTAEKGASSLVRNYRKERETLTYPDYKVRLSAVITLYKLAKQDSSLETLVVRDLLGMLKDEDALVRLAAAAFLSRLKAKIAIQYLREVIPITSDDKKKELIQRYLRELEQG